MAKAAEEANTTAIPDLLNPLRFYKFDITQLVIDRGDLGIDQRFDEFFQDGEYCRRLKQCIKDSSVTYGSYCDIATIKSISDKPVEFLDSDKYTSFCSDEDLTEKVSGITRKICKFSLDSIPTYYIDFTDSSSPFTSYLPNIQGCRPDLLTEFNSQLGSDSGVWQSLPGFQGINFDYNQTGALFKIFLSNATPGDDQERTCQYNLFVCIQPGITNTSNDENIMKLFNTFSSLDETDMQCCNANNVNKIFSHQTIYNYDIDDNRPNFYQIIASIDKAIWEWNKMNYQNTKLINKIRGSLDVKLVHFNYMNWTMTKSSVLDRDCYNLNYDSTSTLRPEIVYDDYWYGDFDAAQTYDNFTITTWYYFSTTNEGGIETLIITPRIAICRG
jgi:hypothetical protein